MRKAVAFLLILLFGFTLLYAQVKEPPEGDWDIYVQDSYTRGDQTFNISLGTISPTIFLNNGKRIDSNLDPPVGGAGNLSYNYFFNSHIYLGGEVGASFNSTLGKNMLYCIFLGAKTGYQFYYWRLEFPVNLSIGMVWQRFLNLRYYGLYMKLGGSAYFRFNSDWSFGLSSNWYWLPQWTDDPKKDVDGNMIDIQLTARYHF